MKGISGAPVGLIVFKACRKPLLSPSQVALGLTVGVGFLGLHYLSSQILHLYIQV